MKPRKKHPKESVERFVKFMEEHPQFTCNETANHLRVSNGYIFQLAKKHHHDFAKYVRGGRVNKPKQLCYVEDGYFNVDEYSKVATY